MKKIRIFGIIAIFVILALCCFTSCNKDSGETDTTTENVDNIVEEKALTFFENGTSDFTLVRTDAEEDYYKTTLSALKNRLEAELETDFKIATDWVNPNKPADPSTHELLLGTTVRTESTDAANALTYSGYMIRVTDHKIVIIGSGLAQTTEAVKYFCDVMLRDTKYNKDGRIAFPVGLEIKKEMSDSEQLDVGTALLAGNDVGADMTKLFGRAGKNGFSISQGAATDGEFVYIAMKKNTDGVETDRILKVDMKTWTVVLESEELPLDHANDMAFDTKGNRLVVTHMKDNLISVIDPETLTVKETITLPFVSWGLAYIPSLNRFVFRGSGGGYSGIIFTDENFNVVDNPAYALDESGYTGQGLDADDKYIYIPQSPDTIKNNRIMVCDLEGNVCGNIIINSTNEIETTFNFNGKYYANFNQGGTTVYALEFYLKFE